MSLYDYRVSQALSQGDPPFAALIMAALRKADTANTRKIRAMWPEITVEMQLRYDSPGGVIRVDHSACQPLAQGGCEHGLASQCPAAFLIDSE